MTAFLFFRYDIFDKSVLYASQRVFRPHKRATVHIWYHMNVDGQCVRRKSLPHRCVILEERNIEEGHKWIPYRKEGLFFSHG